MLSNMPLTRAVFQVIQKHDLILPGARLIVAVSGGADSLALLHILTQLRPRIDLHLHVATLDHGLRGEDGARDVAFVVETARAWGLPVTAGRVDAAALAAERGIGIETAARFARYDFLAGTARQIGTDMIAVAHHADDQAETIVMHLLRGAGLDGLNGMQVRAPVPGHRDLLLLRPLLGVKRAALAAHCAAHHLEPRHDTTNFETHTLRNYIRLEVLPILTRINPQFVDAMDRLSEAASVDSAYIHAMFVREAMPLMLSQDGRVSIDRERFKRLHPALQRRCILWAADSIHPDHEAGHDHVTAAVRIASTGQVGALAQIAGNLQVRVDYDVIVVERAAAPLVEGDYLLLPAGAEVTLSIPGVTVIPGAGWSLEARPAGDDHKEGVGPLLPENASVKLRTRRIGDRFAPVGMDGHSRKLSRWLMDRKVPRALRDRIPLLEVNGRVAAVLVGDQWLLAHGFTLQPERTNETILKKIDFFVNYP